jgi:DNA-directed RNA polymerase subunit H (RpoH/RPB5)
MAEKSDVTKHVLVPKHTKVSEKERKELFEKFNINESNLPRIKKSDPAILNLDVNEGDIVKVMRKSETAGEVPFYRRVTL